MPGAKRIAALEAEAEALRQGIEGYLDDSWRHGWRSERDKCMHGRLPDEPCEECIQIYFRAVLGGLNIDDQGDV